MQFSSLSPMQTVTLRRRRAVPFSFQPAPPEQRRTALSPSQTAPPLWERQADVLPLRFLQRRKQRTVPSRLRAVPFREVLTAFRSPQTAPRLGLDSFSPQRSKPAFFPTYSASSVCLFCSSGLPFYFSHEISPATKTPPSTTIRTGLPHQGEAPGSMALLIMEPMRN